jgi:DNA-binding response OmpR family regulator
VQRKADEKEEMIVYNTISIILFDCEMDQILGIDVAHCNKTRARVSLMYVMVMKPSSLVYTVAALSVTY